MSMAGFKKQWNKASQYMSEKVSGEKGTQLDEDFKELEKKTDGINAFVDQVGVRTREYLQPNPAARTKLSMQSAYQKARGQAKAMKYPQPENNLGDVFTKGYTDINDDSPYCEALEEFGNAFNQMSEIKDSLELNAKQNFLDPLYQLQNKDLREIMQHRKKLEGRRLDFDYKKKKGAKVTDEELRVAEEKFEESRELCSHSMHNLLDSDVEHIGQFYAFSEALRDYHRQCAEVCENLTTLIESKLNAASNRPRVERSFISRPLTVSDSDSSIEHSVTYTPTYTPTPAGSSPEQAPPAIKKLSPQCKALYDFDAENDSELPFREGDIITLISQVDENWLEGSVHGKDGFFPVNYVDILVPL